MKTYVIGDIHGAYKALLQCLERSEFNKEKDTLIQLGDIADGWSEVYECVEELLTIPNLIAIKGNHDDWFNTWIETNSHPVQWLQGGIGTLKSYCNQLDKQYHDTGKGFITDLLDTDIPQTHRDFFRKQAKYYKDDNLNLFVHGGFNRHYLLKEQYGFDDIFWWDRDLWYQAMSVKQLIDFQKDLLDANNFKPKFNIKEPLNEIFIGHTSTTSWKTDKPIHAANIWNLDTGAGFKGKLTIMNIETKEYFQSDEVSELYSNEKGRN